MTHRPTTTPNESDTKKKKRVHIKAVVLAVKESPLEEYKQKSTTPTDMKRRTEITVFAIAQFQIRERANTGWE